MKNNLAKIKQRLKEYKLETVRSYTELKTDLEKDSEKIADSIIKRYTSELSRITLVSEISCSMLFDIHKDLVNESTKMIADIITSRGFFVEICLAESSYEQTDIKTIMVLISLYTINHTHDWKILATGVPDKDALDNVFTKIDKLKRRHIKNYLRHMLEIKLNELKYSIHYQSKELSTDKEDLLNFDIYISKYEINNIEKYRDLITKTIKSLCKEADINIIRLTINSEKISADFSILI